MKMCLGMMAKNDGFLLPLILPLLRPHFDEFIVGYSDSTDGTLKILEAHRSTVIHVHWTNDWAAVRNEIIAKAEQSGCIHMMMIDSDEAMLELDLKTLGQIAFPDAVMFPRYEFVDDFQHWDKHFYPDYQARGFPLNKGFYYSGKTHEQLCKDGVICSQRSPVIRSHCHLFHYGKVKPTREVALKYLNYERLKNGLEPVQELPEGYPIPETWAMGPKFEFKGPKPI